MEEIINQMLSKYNITNKVDEENALKEIVQEIILCGLSRGGFFNHCAFYGGTALRIFYGLDRFSEDLDFTLLTPNENFDLQKYFPYIKQELQSLGLNFDIKQKEKNFESNIKSAFVKGNTKEHIITVYNDKEYANTIPKDATIKIKFEVDVNPPVGAKYETKYGLLPFPYQVKLYDQSSLFAGKIHACLCRNWSSRVKGRDFYDYVFFLSMGTKVNKDNLKAKLVQSRYISSDYDLTIENLKSLLIDRFNHLDFEQAKEDVEPFIKNANKLSMWNKEFFTDITSRLNF